MGKYLPYILGTWNATVTLEESLTICYEVLLVAQLCLTLWDPIDWSLPGSSVRGVFQARILGWVAISFSGRGIFLTHLLWNYISITIQFSSCTFGRLSSVHFNSVTLSCPTLCDPMDCSTPGFPVHHQIPELTQTQVHWVDDAIQPSHPLSSPSPPTFNLFQHQGLFKWVSFSHQVAKVLEFQLQYQSF